MGLDKKIVLVGNGSSILNCDNGQLIDSFDTVVRFNSYKISGFEVNVGTKTDIWFTVNRAHINNARSYQDVIVHSWEWSHSKDIIYQDIKNVRGSLPTYKTDRKFVKTKFPHITPSTGLIAIYHFLESYDCIYITGFDWWSTEEHHYGDNERRGSLHNPAEEFKIIRYLQKLGYLKFLPQNTQK